MQNKKVITGYKEETTSALYIAKTKNDPGTPFQLSFYKNKLDPQSLISAKDLSEIVMIIQEEERCKIGTELHDSVNPLLAIAKVYLELIFPKTEKEIFAKEQIAGLLITAIENVRNVSSELAICERMNECIIHLISELIEKIEGINLFKIQFKHCIEKNTTALSSYLKLVIYRIIQEQLNNIIKHSKAQHVLVNLYCAAGKIKLLISDDGIGFNTAIHNKGIGFQSMAKRIRQFDGLMKIKSAPGKGCSLSITFSY